MISSVKVVNPENASVQWWPKVEWLRGKERIEFKPGLNIVWGPNGSGKSTLLLTIARVLQCAESRDQTVTLGSIRAMFDTGISATRVRDGVVPVYDGQPVMFFDPAKPVGLTGGQIDWDQGDRGLRSLMGQKASAGQQTMAGLGEVLKAAREGLPATRWAVNEDHLNSVWAPAARRVRELLGGDPEAPRGPPTLLLDEPDRSLNIVYQHQLWETLATKFPGRVQVIATSHSPFALMLPGAHYIETVPGDLVQCEDAVRALTRRMQNS